MDNRIDEQTKALPEGVSRRAAIRSLGLGLAGGLLACSGIGRSEASAKFGPATTPTSPGYLLVGSFANNSVLRYDEQTGAFVDQFDPHNRANLLSPYGTALGPDHDLYVSSDIFGKNASVIQYNGATGAFQATFSGPTIKSAKTAASTTTSGSRFRRKRLLSSRWV